MEGTEIREDLTVNILKDDKEKETTELLIYLRLLADILQILGQVDSLY